MADLDEEVAPEKKALVSDQDDNEHSKDNVFKNMDDDWTKSKAKLFMKQFKDKHGDIEDDEKKLVYEDAERQKLLKQEKNKKCFPTTYQDKVVLLIYIICIIAALALVVIYFMFVHKILANIACISGILIVTWIGVLLALIVIYNGGNVRAQAELVKNENDIYWAQLNKMMNLKAEQFKSIKSLLNEYKSLDATETKLQEQTKKFSGLVQEFESLRADWPALDHIFNNLRDTDNILVKLRNSNERAKLFDAFYEAERDGTPGLNEREFEIFFRRIPKRYQLKMERLKLREYKTWDHDGNGNIDTLEFEKMISKLLEAEEEK